MTILTGFIQNKCHNDGIPRRRLFNETFDKRWWQSWWSIDSIAALDDDFDDDQQVWLPSSWWYKLINV